MYSIDRMLGKIDSIQTLIENFPMSIFDSKRGNNMSAFQLLLTILDKCGVDVQEIVNKLTNTVFGVQSNVNLLVHNIDTTLDNIDETIKYGINNIDESSEFINALEDSCKVVLMGLLSSFGCDAIPFIPNKMLDKDTLADLDKKEILGLYDKMMIPVDSIDLFGLFGCCPTSEDGMFYYNTEGRDIYYKRKLTIDSGSPSYEYVECDKKEARESGNVKRVGFVPTNTSDCLYEYIVCYDGQNPNMLYKTMDMNAFLWYVINKGMTMPQAEYNHMMWDSRVSALKERNVGRLTAEEWNDWYNSKEYEGDEFYNVVNGTKVRITEDDSLYPILQIEPSYQFDNTLEISIPSQRYFKPKRREALINGDDLPKYATNETMYKFNWDYLKNIQIFHPKTMLIGFYENLLGVSLASLPVSPFKRILKSKVKNIIKNVIEADDSEVEDCYTSFSNDEFNEMLNETILSKYKLSSNTSAIKQHDISDYVNSIDEVNSLTKEGTITKIQKNVAEITTSGEDDENDLKIDFSFNNISVENLLWALIMPLVESIFTPQIMLLLLINLQATGVVDVSNVGGTDYGVILNTLFNKILGTVKSLIIKIKDALLAKLALMVTEKLSLLILQEKMLVYKEQLDDWLELLNEVRILSLSVSNILSKKTILSTIDDVNYADIENNQTIPESNNTCK